MMQMPPGKVREATLCVRRETGVGRFRIAGFSLLLQKQKEKESIRSGPIIDIGGAKWDIEIWPAGDKNSREGYVRAAVCCTSAKKRLTASYTISVLNQAGEVGLTKEDVAQEFCEKTGWGWSDYISKARLLDPQNGFVSDDVVIFQASVTVLSDPILTGVALAVSDGVVHCGCDPEVSASLAYDLAALFSSGRRTDVVLRVGEEEVRAHGQVLAARSPVFDRMLATGMVEASTGVVRITDISMQVLRWLCEFMYTDAVRDEEVWSDDALLGELMRAAAKYDVPGLVRLCAAKAASRVRVANAAEWLMLAAQLKAEPLKQHCLQVVTSNLSEVQGTDGWQRLMQNKQLFAELGPELFQLLSPPAAAKRRRREDETSKR